MQKTSPIVPRPAATLILCRDRKPRTGEPGIEVLLVQRTYQAVFMPGVFVFPGGAVDPEDDVAALHRHVDGVTPDAANALLDVEHGGLGYMVAALRECFEEAGLLLACGHSDPRNHASPLPYVRHDHAELASQCDLLRQRMLQGETGLLDLCETLGVRLPLDRLAYLSRWVTPAGPPRRFDTRFFIAVAPEGQTPGHDGRETIDHLWISPQEAVLRNQQGELPLGVPTLASLQSLVDFAHTDHLMTHFQRPSAAKKQPRPATGSSGRRAVAPDEPCYPEIEKLDPRGDGHACYEIRPGVVTALSPTVRRITAPNPGAMTGPGTNSYLIGQGGDRAIIDPGPAIESHLDVLLEAADGKLRWILVTHTHRDHSPAAQRLKALTGATLLGMPAPDDDYQDRSFAPDRVLTHGEVIAGEGFRLRVLHTPGHASNHLCYLHEEEGLLFSGDHIMQGSTVVINPPDGHMGDYLASLTALKRERAGYIAPGHGFLMDRPAEVIDRLIAHRQRREDKVLAALYPGPAAETELVKRVYDDVPAVIHPLALRSLLAHLYKLRDEGRAIQNEGRWQLVGA